MILVNLKNLIYVLLEYVEGTDLVTLMDASHMNEQNCSFVGYEVARALEYLDRYRMVHRDIKPDNIMISHEGDVKLVDFGLCKHINEDTISMSKNEFKGTAQYVSPEYIQGEKVTIKSDIYALGVTLYFMATQYMPFDDEDVQKICDLHLTYTPLPVKDLNQNISKEFSDVVMQMLDKDPRKRPSLPYIIQCMGEIMPTKNA